MFWTHLYPGMLFIKKLTIIYICYYYNKKIFIKEKNFNSKLKSQAKRNLSNWRLKKGLVVCVQKAKIGFRRRFEESKRPGYKWKLKKRFFLFLFIYFASKGCDSGHPTITLNPSSCQRQGCIYSTRSVRKVSNLWPGKTDWHTWSNRNFQSSLLGTPHPSLSGAAIVGSIPRKPLSK